MTLAQQVGKRLKECRKAKGLTQLVVSMKLGIPQQHYSLYEQGKIEMDYERLLFICNLYETTVGYVLGNTK